MMRNILAGAILALLATAGLAAGQSCGRVVPAEANRHVLPEKGLDQGLMDRLIQTEVNYHRCHGGLRPVVPTAALNTVALTHATWMAKARTVSHTSKVPGHRTLPGRLSTSGLKIAAGGENVGMVHRFALEGAKFITVDAGSCQFVRLNGKRIGMHSYASLSRLIVDLWMASPGHRKNIMNPKLTRMGTAFAFSAKAPHCGQFYLAQNFTG